MESRINRLQNENSLLSQKLQLAQAVMRRRGVIDLYDKNVGNLEKKHYEDMRKMKEKNNGKNK